MSAADAAAVHHYSIEFVFCAVGCVVRLLHHERLQLECFTVSAVVAAAIRLEAQAHIDQWDVNANAEPGCRAEGPSWGGERRGRAEGPRGGAEQRGRAEDGRSSKLSL